MRMRVGYYITFVLLVELAVAMWLVGLLRPLE